MKRTFVNSTNVGRTMLKNQKPMKDKAMKMKVYSARFETESIVLTAENIGEATDTAYSKAGNGDPIIYELEYVNYGSTGTCAYYDSETDTYYNEFGQVLRDPNEYNQNSEGYTPFGDE